MRITGQEELIILSPAAERDAQGKPVPHGNTDGLYYTANVVFKNYVRCFVDAGVEFPFDDDYALPEFPPEHLDAVKCIAADPRREEELRSGPHAARLKDFERRGGHVFFVSLGEAAGGAIGDSMVRPRVLRDINTAGLTVKHPRFVRRLEDKPEPPMIERWKRAAEDELGQYVRMGHPFSDPPGYISLRAATEAAEHFGDPALAEPAWRHVASQYAQQGKHFDSCGGRTMMRYSERTGDRKVLDPLLRRFERPRLWRLDGVELNCDVKPPEDADPDDIPPRVRANAWTWPETAAGLGDTLGGLARLTGNVHLTERAVTHVLNAHRWLFAPDLGLWYHVGRPDGPDRRSAPWGRGNAWFLYGLRGLLDDLPDDHPRRPELVRALADGLEGILRAQNRHGLWYNVLDAAEGESRECSSATSRFIHVFARAYWKGWLRDERIPPMAERAWLGLKTKIWDWALIAYCVGTPHMLSRQGYLSRPHDTFRCSRSSLLLAWIELQRMRAALQR